LWLFVFNFHWMIQSNLEIVRVSVSCWTSTWTTASRNTCEMLLNDVRWVSVGN